MLTNTYFIIHHIIIHLKQIFFGNGLGPTLSLGIFNSVIQKKFLPKDMQRGRFGAQKTFWIHKLKLSLKFKKTTTMTQL
jgi:hypothetical protein